MRYKFKTERAYKTRLLIVPEQRDKTLIKGHEGNTVRKENGGGGKKGSPEQRTRKSDRFVLINWSKKMLVFV